MNNDKNSEKAFPGYPHYPPGEDITNNGKEMPMDMGPVEKDGDVNQTTGDENGITAEDLAALEQEDNNIVATRLDSTDEDGTPLDEKADAKDMGADLDVPGAELDNANEDIGEEDEENNYYSLGDNDTNEDTEGIP